MHEPAPPSGEGLCQRPSLCDRVLPDRVLVGWMQGAIHLASLSGLDAALWVTLDEPKTLAEVQAELREGWDLVATPEELQAALVRICAVGSSSSLGEMS